ncbi:hypothetical protein HQ531_13585 [bacterium]|nr:hypothetical protein [bacterium]
MSLNNKIGLGILLIVVLSGSLLQSCSNKAEIVNLELNIEELVCSDGQLVFEGRILALEGIKAVTANIQNQKAQIRFRNNQVSEEQIKTHLLDFGFTINDVPGNTVARGRLPACCFKN